MTGTDLRRHWVDRHDGTGEHLEDVRIVSLETRRGAVLRILQDGRWHSTAELDHPAVGGSEGTRRLRELRKLGYTIEKRRHEGHDDFEYRLLSVTEAIRRKRA